MPTIAATTGVVLAAAAVGSITNATDLMRLTRPLMDANSAGIQAWLRDTFPAAANPAVSAAMDRIPGAEYAGGTFHRLHHGHDLVGFIESVRAFGFDGAASWMNHVGLRDLWTPHGVPWLPAGSADLFAWLADLGLPKTLVASILSVNAATLAGAALGLLATTAFRQAIRVATQRGEARSMLDNAYQALDAGDPVTACERLRPLAAHPGATTALKLAVAMASLQAAKEAVDPKTRTTVARLAADWLRQALIDRKADVRGRSIPAWSHADVSATGLATLLYGQAMAFGYDVEDAVDSRYELMRTGIHELLRHADRLNDPPRVAAVGRPRRPLTASVNYTMALDIVLAYPHHLAHHFDPRSVRQKLHDALASVDDRAARAYAAAAWERLERRYPLELVA